MSVLKRSLGRVITAMITPFNEDGTVKQSLYKKTTGANATFKEIGAVALGRHLVEHGSEGLLVGATTGEGATMTNEEKLRLYQLMVRELGPQVPIIANTGGIDTLATIEFTKQVAETGVDAVLVICPFYVKPTQEGLYRHFTTIAHALPDVPIMVYNVPGRTRSDIKPATLKRVVDECPNVIGVKDATGNLEQVSEERRILPDDFLIYSGDDSITLPIMSVGGDGVISVASHVVGDDMLAMIDAYQHGDVKKAQQLHIKMFPIMTGLFFITSPIPVKTAMNLLGLPGGAFRLPMVDANEEETAFVRSLLVNYGLLDA